MALVVSRGGVLRSSINGKEYTISSDEIDFEAVAGEERGMGGSTTYEAYWEPDDGSGSITWTFIEYPVGAENHRDVKADGFTIVQDIHYGLEPDPYDD